jgi:hypothetical protein
MGEVKMGRVNMEKEWKKLRLDRDKEKGVE